MSVTVCIPSALRHHTRAKARVVLDAATVGEAIQSLCGQFPGLRVHIVAEDGSLRPFVNVYVNQDDIRSKLGQQTALKAQDVLSIIPSIAGG